MSWRCFMLEETGRGAAWLRRYSTGVSCPTCHNGYHQAHVRIENVHYWFDAEARHWRDDGKMPPDSDPRWPLTAPCGYVFTPDDVQQLFTLATYRSAEHNEVVVHPNPPPGATPAPPGAMWWAPWAGREEWGPEGKGGLMLLLPGGTEWNVYGYSTAGAADGKPVRGPKWTVSGVPPRLTAQPSINAVGSYHGWLQDGVLSDPI